MTAASADAPSSGELRAVLDALERVQAQLGRLEALAHGVGAEGRSVVGIVTDAVDRRIAEAQARGVDVDARAARLLALMEKLSEPGVLAALEHAVSALPSLPALLGVAVDAADQAVGRLQASGLDLDRRLANLVRAAERLSSDEALAMLDALFGRIDRIRLVLESGVFDAAAVSIVAKAGRALADAAAEPAHRVGAFGLMRALGEAEVRSALGLLLSFARRMGGALHRDSALPRLSARDINP